MATMQVLTHIPEKTFMLISHSVSSCFLICLPQITSSPSFTKCSLHTTTGHLHPLVIQDLPYLSSPIFHGSSWQPTIWPNRFLPFLCCLCPPSAAHAGPPLGKSLSTCPQSLLRLLVLEAFPDPLVNHLVSVTLLWQAESRC